MKESNLGWSSTELRIEIAEAPFGEESLLVFLQVVYFLFFACYTFFLIVSNFHSLSFFSIRLGYESTAAVRITVATYSCVDPQMISCSLLAFPHPTQWVVGFFSLRLQL